MIVKPANTRRGIHRSARLFLWLMWQVEPNRKETPLRVRARMMPMMGMPQPANCEAHMNLRPTTTCQQIWRCRDRDRRKTHMIPDQPPRRRRVPEAAQTELDFIPLGVIVSKH